MQSSFAKLFLVCVLSIVSWSYVEADKKVTITGFNVDVPGNDVLDSWKSDIAKNLIESTINIKKNCPGVIEIDIKVYKGDNVVNRMNQKLSKPMHDLESYGVCGVVDAVDLDDDQCSIAEGEQVAKDCDISGWFSDMEPGDYRAECDFTQNNNVIANAQVDVKVENE